MRQIKLTSDVPFQLPRNRWSINDPRGIDSNQLNGELIEHKACVTALEAVNREAMALHAMVPKGYTPDPVRYTYDRGVILISLVARSE